MKIQKTIDNKIVSREISEDDLGYFLHKGWEVAVKADTGSNTVSDFSINRKKKHRFDDEA